MTKLLWDGGSIYKKAMKAAVTSIRGKRGLKVNDLSSKLATPKDMNVNAEPKTFTTTWQQEDHSIRCSVTIT